MYRFTVSESHTSRYSVLLGDYNDKYMLSLTEDKNSLETRADIFKYYPSDNAWHSVYSEVMKGMVDVKFYNLPWNLTNSYVLVLYSSGSGSGGFLSYELLETENESVKKLVSEDSIFQGTVFFQGNQLIRGTGNQFWVWDKVYDTYILEPYRMPVYPKAQVIRYSIADQETVNIAQSSFTIPIGSYIQLLREDFNNSAERTLLSSTPSCIDFVKPSVFKFTCKTKATVTIIPDGYNWDGAKEINITVI